MEPSELWAALTAIPRPTREVPIPRNIPGTDTPIGTVVMWPLTQEEQMLANAEADRFTKTLLKDPQKKEEANLGYQHTFTNEVAIQVLYRACRDPKFAPEYNRPAFPSPGLMREKLSSDEIGVLFSEYCTIQSELGPIRAHMSKEEMDALIVRLVEGGSEFPLDFYSSGLQRTLPLSLAYRLVDCWMAMRFAGLPLDVSSSVLEMLKRKSGEVDEITESAADETGDDASTNDGDNTPSS